MRAEANNPIPRNVAGSGLASSLGGTTEVLSGGPICYLQPAVRGISTEVLWEHEQVGETVSDIAADFALSDEDVLWALAYETSARTKAA